MPQRALGGGIGDDRRPSEFAGDGADIDDPAAASLQHARADRLRDVKDAVEVDAHDFAPGFFRETLERSASLNSGVVDENVDRSDFPFDLGDGRAGRFARGHVEGGGKSGDLLVLQRRSGLFELGGVAPVQYDARARSTERPRQGQSDSLAGTRHQRDAAAQAKQFQQ